MADRQENPWPGMRDALIERLKESPPAPPKPKPDYRAIYNRRRKEEQT